MSVETQQFKEFLKRFQNVAHISTHKEIDKSQSYLVFVVSVLSDGEILKPQVSNLDHVYSLFYINTFRNYKFSDLNIVELIDTNSHIHYWQVKYKI